MLLRLKQMYKNIYARREQTAKEECERLLRLHYKLSTVTQSDINCKDNKHRPLSQGKPLKTKSNQSYSLHPRVDAYTEWRNMLASLQRDINTAKLTLRSLRRALADWDSHWITNKDFIVRDRIWSLGPIVTDNVQEMTGEIWDEKYVITTEANWGLHVNGQSNSLATGYVVCKARSNPKWNIFYTCEAKTTRFGIEHQFHQINIAGGITRECVDKILDGFHRNTPRDP